MRTIQKTGSKQRSDRNAKRLRREREAWQACLEPRPIERKEVEPTALALAIEADVQAAVAPQKPRMLRDGREVKLWLPPRLHERLTGLLDGQPVSGLVGELLAGWLAEREGVAA